MLGVENDRHDFPLEQPEVDVKLVAAPTDQARVCDVPTVYKSKLTGRSRSPELGAVSLASSHFLCALTLGGGCVLDGGFPGWRRLVA